jgi:hypothetical protein
MANKYNYPKKKLSRHICIMLFAFIALIFAQNASAFFIISEVSPRPVNSTLEFVELYFLEYNGEQISIVDNYASSTISSMQILRNGIISDYDNESYNGYALITQYPEHFIDMISNESDIECMIIGLSGRIGNGLADGGDEVNVTIYGTSRFFSYTSSVRGQSYNNPCDENDCVENEAYTSSDYYLDNETPCTGLFSIIMDEDIEDEHNNDNGNDDSESTDDDVNNDDNEDNDESIEDDNTEEIIGEDEAIDEDNNDTSDEEDVDEAIQEETDNTNNSECLEITIQSQNAPFTTRIEYRIISKGTEYEYWIERYNGSIAKKSAISKTNAIKTFTPKQAGSEEEMIFRIVVKYNDSCIENRIIEHYVMFVHQYKDEETKEAECLPCNATSNAQAVLNSVPKNALLKSFYTRAQKRADEYNFFFSTGNLSNNTMLYACSIMPVTDTESNKHVFAHNIISRGMPVLLALDDNYNVLEAIVGAKPEFIANDETAEYNISPEQSESEEKSLSNAITSSALKTIMPANMPDGQKEMSFSGALNKAQPYAIPALLIGIVGFAAFRKIR